MWSLHVWEAEVEKIVHSVNYDQIIAVRYCSHKKDIFIGVHSFSDSLVRSRATLFSEDYTLY